MSASQGSLGIQMEEQSREGKVFPELNVCKVTVGGKIKYLALIMTHVFFFLFLLINDY